MCKKRKMHLKFLIGICGITVFSMLFMTGCWDRVEINDLALITATAYDLAPRDELQYTVQIMLPAGGASAASQSSTGSQQKKSFTVETAVGIDPGDAERKIQKIFPRKLFRGHRRVIIIGEALAMHGLEKMLDSIGRDPQNRLRTDVLVAKGKKGLDLLNTDYPMERVPAEAMREMVSIGIGVDVNIRDFLIAASSEGTQPIAATIEQDESKEGFKLTGIAIFKGLKLAGYLDAEDTEGYLWVRGKYKKGIIATTVPENEGVIRINVKNAKTKVTPEIRDGKVKIYLDLKGEGSIFGNSTNLDFTVPANITLAQEAIKTKIKTQVENTLKVTQKDYGADIFGFGTTISQHKPKEWKLLREKWNKIFPDVEVYVSTSFKIRMPGMSGPPLYLNEDEVKKK